MYYFYRYKIEVGSKLDFKKIDDVSMILVQGVSSWCNG